MSTTFDYRRIGYMLAGVAVSGVVARYGQALLHENRDAINVIVTTFSILAGFLVAIMTIVGDPVLFARRSWRADAIQKHNTYARLVRQRWLFILYLWTLALIFIAALVARTMPWLAVWLEYAYLFLATFSFLASLFLPSTLMSIQMERYELLIAEKKRKQPDPG